MPRRPAAGTRTARPPGGVDANASKRHLYDLAKQLKIPGRSSMSKTELVTALQKANDRESAKSRAKKSSKKLPSVQEVEEVEEVIGP